MVTFLLIKDVCYLMIYSCLHTPAFRVRHGMLVLYMTQLN